MASFLLASNDYDKELILKLNEKAKEQNIPVITFQRDILCDIFNIPKDYDAETIYYLMYEMLHERSVEQNISKKQIVRNCFRGYFGMTTPRAKLRYTKIGGPLQVREKRFQILSFLVTVDAATQQEIADHLKTTKKSIAESLRFNSQYFEFFHIPYDRRRRWRVTEKGRQDYFAIVNRAQTVRELKVENQGIENIPHLNDYWNRMQFEADQRKKQEKQQIENERQEREKKKQELELKVKAEEAEKAERRRKFEQTVDQKRKESTITRRAESAEKEQYRDISLRNEQLILKHRKDRENTKQNENRGIEKYFMPDRKNPYDIEIVRRLEALGRDDTIQQERFCKVILCKQLSIDTDVRAQNTDHRIEQALLKCCQKNGKEKNDYVRELFSTHFRIRSVAPK